MLLRIAGTVNDSIVDGPGIRYTIFTQGCPHNCPGCHNPQTHDFDSGKLVDTDKLFQEIVSNPLLDGVSFSGGEPFCQAEALAYLAERIHTETNLNVITYTGYTFEDICNKSLTDNAWKALISQTDVLIDGPYIQDKSSYDIPFRGSTNQRYIDVKQSLSKNAVVEADI